MRGCTYCFFSYVGMNSSQTNAPLCPEARTPRRRGLGNWHYLVRQSRNASAKAQRALESSSKLQKPPRKQTSLHSPRETPFVPQHPGFPTVQSKTKASLTALTQSKPLPLLLHIFIKYAILFWQLHVRFHAFFFKKKDVCSVPALEINLTPVSARLEAKNN